jgi:hypothetical protein
MSESNRKAIFENPRSNLGSDKAVARPVAEIVAETVAEALFWDF